MRARQELKRRFLKVNDTDNEDTLKDRLERVLDEEFNYGIIFDDKDRGTGKGLGKVLMGSGLFDFENAKLLGVGEDGEITNEEQIKKYGHESAYFALLEMRRERKGKDQREEDPTQLVFSKVEVEEIENNFSKADMGNNSNRKRKIEGEMVTLCGKQFLFVKAAKSPIEPNLKDYISNEVDTEHISVIKKEKREEEIKESKVGCSFFSSSNHLLRGSYFIFDVDVNK
eukprot:TRINITY_DN6377_c0_g1_i1.p1 TRINITY_DN6377_c0_g1~~TRINITY_DN6377_c0_g1_i1.p1  ORF type:complete len:227 (-),score=66.73 TRINITY_DN6377_c0_g1_i1:85-765(-)